MRNAIIGIVLITILVITSVTIYGLETKTTRQNELDANLSSAMKSSMQIMAIDPTYTIDKENNEHLIADFIENFLIRMNGNAEFEIDILAIDTKKGLLSVRVIERYQSIFAESSVDATRTLVLDKYENAADEYFKVTFYQSYSDGKYKDPVKQINVYGGSNLEGFEPASPIRQGYTFKGWKLEDIIYTDLSTIEVTDDINFVAVWEKDEVDIYTIAFYVDNVLLDSAKVKKGMTIGEHQKAPDKEDYDFVGWSSRNGECLTDDEVANMTINGHKTFTAIYQLKK